ncbi:MAG: hypothetical protein DRG63_06635 [Deltaproteobacteria bacterium]|nr:MAG: hypothetical protein DRG63_06635 [Deltaproteobacteria bacterium]
MKPASSIAAHLGPKSLLRTIIQHPWHVIIINIVITLIFAVQLPNLRFRTSIYDLAIEDLPQTKQYQTFKQTFGSEEIILVVAKAQHIFDPKTFAQLDNLGKKLSKVKGVKRIVSLPEARRAIDLSGQMSLGEFRAIISPIELFKNNLISWGERTTAICLVLKDIKSKKTVIEKVREIIKEEPLYLYQIGMPIVANALARFTKKDFFHLPPITFLIIALVLFLFMRTPRGVIIPAGSVIMGLIWTFGLMAWTGTPLSMLTMIVPVFLIAVGTAYCMYIFPEYDLALSKSDKPVHIHMNFGIASYKRPSLYDSTEDLITKAFGEINLALPKKRK